MFGFGFARSSAQLGSVLTSVRYSLLVSKLNVINQDQFDSEFGLAQLGAGLGSVLSVLMFGSARLEAKLVLARSLDRRNSRIDSAKLRIRPALTRLKTRYSAKLCSKLRSGVGSVFSDSELKSA